MINKNIIFKTVLFLSIILVFATNANAISYPVCDDIKNPYYKDLCEEDDSFVRTRYASQYSGFSADDCETSDNQLDCFNYLGAANMDLSMCNRFDVWNNNKANCYRNVGIGKLDISVCNQISEYYTSYINSCYERIAVNTNEISICNKIQDNYLKNSCYSLIASNKGDISICDNIQDSSWKDYCYKNLGASSSTSSASTIIGGDLSDSLEQGETKTYTLGGKDYEVTNVKVSDSGTIYTQLMINGILTKNLQSSDLVILKDGTIIKIMNILLNGEGDISGDIVEFSISNYRLDQREFDELSTSMSIFYTLKEEVEKIKSSNADSPLVSGSKNILTEMQNALSNAEEQIKQGKKEDAIQSLQKIPELQKQFETIKQTSTLPKPVSQATNLSSSNRLILYRILGVVAALLIIIILIFSYKKVRSVFRAKDGSKEKKSKSETIKSELKTTQLKSYEHAIEVSDFTLNVKKTDILKDVSFKIRKGEMACLLGPSGTGKSTVIESLVGRKSPTKGNIKLLGEDIQKSKFIYDYVGFVPQHAELYNSQTVMQNMLNSAIKYNIKNAESKADKLLDKLSLSNRKSLKAGSLSGGQQKLLSLGMELIRDVELIILDEPTTGLDPNTRNSIMTILTHISSQLHKTIFFTTHFMDDAEECDEVIILNNKKIVAQGHPTKLEKMLPGGGRVVNIILDNVTDDLIAKIEKIEDIEKVVREGRNLRIITNNPNAIKLGQKVDELGGVVNETKIDKASMMDVFVYHTGEKLDD